MRPIQKGRCIAAAALMCAAFVVVQAPASAGVRTLMVVASGDSYASGEGAIELDKGWANATCHRSNLAGPQNATVRLTASGHPTTFVPVTCSGATTASMLGSGGQLAALPSVPIDALTMSIGGNDIGFAGIVTRCLVSDCTASDGAVTVALAGLPTSLAAVFAAVPQNVANVFVTEYPDPTTGLLGLRCGNLLAPGFQGFDTITEAEAIWASTRVVARLNAALAAAVAAAEARPGPHPVFHFVTGISAAFASHGYCTGGGSPSPLFPATWLNPRYVNTPLDSTSSQLDVLGSMHPNDIGQQVIGEVLFETLRFLGDPLTLSATTSPNRAIVNAPAVITTTVRTSRGTPVPRAVVFVDGVQVGRTDQQGALTVSHVFTTQGRHLVTVDHDPYPAVSRGIDVLGAEYMVFADPSRIPMGVQVTVALRANDTAGGLIPGTFTLISGTGQRTLQSGQSATVRLTMRYVVEDKEKYPVCPEVLFEPSHPAYSPRDVSDLVDCFA